MKIHMGFRDTKREGEVRKVSRWQMTSRPSPWNECEKVLEDRNTGDKG